MGPGTLYGSLGRMIDAGLIRESDKKVDPKMDDERRVYYKITGLGQKALAAELERYREVVAVAKQRLSPNALMLRLWQMNTQSRDTGTGIGNCSASIRGRTASASRRAWSKHSTTSAVNAHEAGEGLLGFVLWMFVETSAGIVRENARFIMMQNITRRLLVWAAVVALILLVPLLARAPWDLFDFVVMGGLLFGVGLAYELVARRSGKTVYRIAFGIGLVTAFLLAWVNGAVGIIGSENQPANLMYGAVFAVGVIGSLVARFRPRGMAHTLFAAALVQLSVPVIALIIWPQISWGGAGLAGVFVLNAFFAALFVVSALLFRQAAEPGPKSK